MIIKILTLFPEMFDGFLTNSIIKRTIAKKAVEFKIINIRDYTKDKYGRVDTPPVGGGAGLIMKCQPLFDAIEMNKTCKSRVILLAPKGQVYSQVCAKKYAKLEDLIIICGHYEGIDARIEEYVDEIISIGDYVLTGGEIGAMVIADSVTRLLDGAISESSLNEESFENGILEYPQYTEPYEFNGKYVPDILYSGNHTAIAKYHRKKALETTMQNRPDLLNKITLSKNDKKLVEEIQNNEVGKWESNAIEKGKKFMHKKSENN